MNKITKSKKENLKNKEIIIKKDFYIKRAKDAYIYDYHQNKYTDFNLCNGSITLGHANAKITKAIKCQTSKGYILEKPNHLKISLEKLIKNTYKNKYKEIIFHNSLSSILKNISNKEIKTNYKEEILFIGSYYKKIPNINPKNIISQTENIKLISKKLKEKKIKAVLLSPIILSPKLNHYKKDFINFINNQKSKITIIKDETQTAFKINQKIANQIKADKIILGPSISSGLALYCILSNNKTISKNPYPPTTTFQTINYISSIETIKQLKKEENNPKHLKLIKTLSQKKLKNWEIKTIGSIFQITNKTLSQKEHYNFFLNQKVIINNQIENLSYISHKHKPQDIKNLLKILN